HPLRAAGPPRTPSRPQPPRDDALAGAVPATPPHRPRWDGHEGVRRQAGRPRHLEPHPPQGATEFIRPTGTTNHGRPHPPRTEGSSLSPCGHRERPPRHNLMKSPKKHHHFIARRQSLAATALVMALVSP